MMFLEKITKTWSAKPIKDMKSLDIFSNLVDPTEKSVIEKKHCISWERRIKVQDSQFHVWLFLKHVFISYFEFCKHIYFHNFFFHICIFKDIKEVIPFLCVRSIKTIFLGKGLLKLPNNTWLYHPAISCSKSFENEQDELFVSSKTIRFIWQPP